ncbi:MAG: Prolipoprotein diacylglyceryl transferase, partial [uncultured Solirubrobacteraceae bacterium]
ATRDRALRPDDLHVRPDGRRGVHRGRLGRLPAPRRARPLDRLVLRGGLLRPGRRRPRREALVGRRGVGLGRRRRARRAALARGPGLVRRPRRRGGRRPPVDAPPQPGPAHGRRPGRAGARTRLRRGPDRLPAGRRRRLRRAVGPAVGDGLSGGHRADDGGGPSDTGLRVPGHECGGRPALAPARPDGAGRPVRPVPGASGPGALPGRVRAPQRARARRPQPGPARLAGDDRGGSGVAAGAAPRVRSGRRGSGRRRPGTAL